jgi:hypothetical protein
VKNWITDIWRWGNNSLGTCTNDIPILKNYISNNECNLSSGPRGFSSKGELIPWLNHWKNNSK